MKYFIAFVTTLILSIGSLYAQSGVITLDVVKAGTLRNLLSEEQYKTTTGITLTGEINALDIKVLQEMSSEKGILEAIDLSGVKIVACEEEQPIEHETFSSLPLPTLSLGSSKSDVEAYEQQNKGTYSAEKSNPEEGLHELMWYDIKDHESIIHCYFISQNGQGVLDEFWGFYPAIEKAVIATGDSFSLTGAFIQLLVSSGFTEPQYLEGEGFVAKNREKNLDVMICVSSLEELDSTAGAQDRVLVLMYAPAGEYIP